MTEPARGPTRKTPAEETRGGTSPAATGSTGPGADHQTPDGSSPTHWPRELDAQYEQLGELGRGGMAVVFRARDRELGRDVAIKVVRPRFAADEEAVARLAREARTVAQLEHPNIVGVYSIRHLDEGSVALVMQLVPGRTLKAAIQQEGRFDASRAERVLRDIARALTYAHKAGVVHRDVKPENIFLDDVTGRALLSDFGVARVMDAPAELTATGTTIGTPTYMPPEQIDGLNIDGRSDLYSLGMVGWEMLSGQRPWAGENLYSVIYHQKHDPLPPLESIRNDVPARLQYLVEGMMHKNPDRRWSGAARFLALLSSDQILPGFREWQSAQWRRRRSMVYQQARTRGESVVEAALETVRFNRADTPAAAPAPPSSSAAAAAPAPTATSAPPSPEAAQPAPWEMNPALAAVEHAFPPATFSTAAEPEIFTAAPRPSRRGPVFVAAGVLLAIAAMVAWLQLREETVAPVARRSVPSLDDRPGIEVPVIPAVIASKPSDSGRRDRTPIGDADPARRTLSPSTLPAATAPRLEQRPSGRGAIVEKSAPAEKGTPRQVPGVTSRSTPPNEPDSATRRVSRAAPGRSAAPSPTAVAPPLRSADASAAPPVVAAAAGTPALNFPAERGIIAAGERHSCMLAGNGRASCWGNNEQGQVGDGTFEVRPTPTAVVGEFTFAQISASAWHTCGLTSRGDLYCWGRNDDGQLGDGTTSVRSAPVRVNTSTDFKLVRAGSAHTCALSRANSVFCWGRNEDGQLGDGTRSMRASPVPVSVPSPVAALSVGASHTCAITSDGSAFCWGRNSEGQLGDGNTLSRADPVAIDTELRFVSIAAGGAHTCAVAQNGDAFCWGRNNYGQLGTGVTGRAIPAPLPVDSPVQFFTVVAGNGHSCARGRDGHAWCWGRNVHGQLGDGTTADRSRPFVVQVMTGVTALHASGAHTCGIASGGEAYCWGWNIDGQLGRGDRDNASTPARVVPRAR